MALRIGSTPATGVYVTPASGPPVPATGLYVGEVLAWPTPSAIGFAQDGSLWNATDATVDAHAQAVQRLGGEWIRITVTWRDLNITRGTYNWSKLERQVAAAKKYGLKILVLSLGNAPTWSWNGFQGDPGDYGVFNQAMAAKFRGDIHAIELWNEPNLSRFWPVPVDPADYIQYLRKGYEGIKAAAPEITVVSAGLSPAVTARDAQGRLETIAPLEYLNGLLSRGGANYMDAIGWHPYCWPSVPGAGEDWSAWTQMEQAIAQMKQAGINKPIWITEFGAPTDGGANAMTEAGQWDSILRAFRIVRGRADFGPVFIYQAIDSPGVSGTESHFGLVTTGGAQKLSSKRLGY